MKLVEQHHTYLNERFAYYPSIELFDNCERTEFDDNIVNVLRIDFDDGTRSQTERIRLLRRRGRAVL